MKVEVGNCPTSWGTWFPDGGPSFIKYEEFLQEVAEAGYSFIESAPYGYLPVDPVLLKEKLAEFNLKICAGSIIMPYNKIKTFSEFIPQIDPLLKQLKAMDVRYMVAMGTANEGDGPLDINKTAWTSETYHDLFKKSADLSKYAKEEYGVTAVFHPHADMVFETEKEIDDLMNYTDVALCLDTGHHAYANGELKMNDQSPINYIRKYKSRLKYMHFKNVDLTVLKKVREQKLSALDAFSLGVMCDLEDGMVNFLDVKNVLEEINYNGYAVIEQDNIDQPRDYGIAKAKKNHDYLKKIGLA